MNLMADGKSPKQIEAARVFMLSELQRVEELDEKDEPTIIVPIPVYRDFLQDRIDKLWAEYCNIGFSEDESE